RDGYRRLWLDGQARDIDTVAPSALGPEQRVRVVVDRCHSTSEHAARLASSIEAAWQRSGGLAEVFLETLGATTSSEPLTVRRGRSCPACARPLGKASMGLFSYESPLGACP